MSFIYLLNHDELTVQYKLLLPLVTINCNLNQFVAVVHVHVSFAEVFDYGDLLIHQHILDSWLKIPDVSYHIKLFPTLHNCSV